MSSYFVKYTRHCPLTNITKQFAPNPNNEDGFMHLTNTLDYIFIIGGEVELTLDHGEKRAMKRGGVCIQRASMHAWKNVSKRRK